jgi:hypothetical protein
MVQLKDDLVQNPRVDRVGHRARASLPLPLTRPADLRIRDIRNLRRNPTSISSIASHYLRFRRRLRSHRNSAQLLNRLSMFQRTQGR